MEWCHFRVKLLKLCKLVCLSYALGDDDDGSGASPVLDWVWCFIQSISLWAIGERERYDGSDVYHELIKMPDSICVANLWLLNLNKHMEMYRITATRCIFWGCISYINLTHISLTSLTVNSNSNSKVHHQKSVLLIVICFLGVVKNKRLFKVKNMFLSCFFSSCSVLWDFISVCYEQSPHWSLSSSRLLPLESILISVPSRIHLRLRRHELPHYAALLPGSHLHDWSSACRCAWRSG